MQTEIVQNFEYHRHLSMNDLEISSDFSRTHDRLESQLQVAKPGSEGTASHIDRRQPESSLIVHYDQSNQYGAATITFKGYLFNTSYAWSYVKKVVQ